jgi:hypothetical protein
VDSGQVTIGHEATRDKEEIMVTQEMRERWQAGMSSPTWQPDYGPWRHGGWYVYNLHHPEGGCGCVSRNYPDKKWRIVGHDGPGSKTYRTRDEAAQAERRIALAKYSA